MFHFYLELLVSQQLLALNPANHMAAIDPKTLPFLPVQLGNSLLLTNTKSENRKGMDNDDDFYDEVNVDGLVVAKYHVWHHLNIYPPQNVDAGWQKTLPDGRFVASGKKP